MHGWFGHQKFYFTVECIAATPLSRSEAWVDLLRCTKTLFSNVNRYIFILTDFWSLSFQSPRQPRFSDRGLVTIVNYCLLGKNGRTNTSRYQRALFRTVDRRLDVTRQERSHVWRRRLPVRGLRRSHVNLHCGLLALLKLFRPVLDNCWKQQMHAGQRDTVELRQRSSPSPPTSFPRLYRHVSQSPSNRNFTSSASFVFLVQNICIELSYT